MESLNTLKNNFFNKFTGNSLIGNAATQEAEREFLELFDYSNKDSIYFRNGSFNLGTKYWTPFAYLGDEGVITSDYSTLKVYSIGSSSFGRAFQEINGLTPGVTYKVSADLVGYGGPTSTLYPKVSIGIYDSDSSYAATSLELSSELVGTTLEKEFVALDEYMAISLVTSAYHTTEYYNEFDNITITRVN